MKSDFKGTGTMVEFVDESNKMFSALTNARVIVPTGYSGQEPTLRIDETGAENASLVLDMGEALVFTLNNIEWEFFGDAAITSKGAYVRNGKLHIQVTAVSVCP